MVITVFRSRILPDAADEFEAQAETMMDLAKSMPGFLSYKLYTADDGERCSIVEFESPEHLRAWREHPDHMKAMQIGRERYYAEYSLHVSVPERESRFSR